MKNKSASNTSHNFFNSACSNNNPKRMIATLIFQKYMIGKFYTPLFPNVALRGIVMRKISFSFVAFFV